MLGFNFPGQGDERTGLRLAAGGRLEAVQDIAELRQALMMLFSVRPGERPMRPEFGCSLDRLAFEPNDATTAGLAMRLVIDAITNHEPRAEVESIDAGPDPEDRARLRIELTYRDRRSGTADRLSVVLPLDGSA